MQAQVQVKSSKHVGLQLMKPKSPRQAEGSRSELVMVFSAKSSVMAHSTYLRRGIVDAPGSPFAPLQLSQTVHVNKRRYDRLRKPSSELQWAQLFQDPQRPLVVDVGCGQGRCLLLLAAQQEARVQQQSHHHHYHHQESLPEIQQDFTEGPPHEVPEVVSSSIDLPLGMNHLCGSTEVNFLGLDVGASIVSQANQWAGERGLSHCLQYVTSDASESLQQLRLYPGPVHAVAVQFPDPHYRNARHVVTPAFVSECVALLEPGGVVLLQSDMESTAVAMRDTFYRCGGFAFEPHNLHLQEGQAGRCSSSNSSSGGSASTGGSALDAWSRHHSMMGAKSKISRGDCNIYLPDVSGSAWADAGWLLQSPWAPTEREVYHAQITGAPVFRLLLQRNSFKAAAVQRTL